MTVRPTALSVVAAQQRARLRRAPVPHCDRCVRLEHVLYEELGQELAGMALMLAAARCVPASASGLDAALATIAGLLASAIGRCRCAPGAPESVA